MVEALIDSEELRCAINIFAEVLIVGLINVTLVHISTEESLSDVLGSANAKEIKNTKELSLCNVTIASDIVVLEDRLKVNALVLNSSFVLFEDSINLSCVLFTSKVLSTGKKSVSSVDWGNSCCWSLINSSDSECAVDVCTEISVTEEAFRVCRLVLLGQSFKFIVGQGEVHG